MEDRSVQLFERLHARWLERAMASYSPEAGEAWGRERDRFANPVGHALREGTRRVLEALLGDAEPEAVKRGLDTMVRMRAVQSLSPIEAVGFVLELKEVVRAEVHDPVPGDALPIPLPELDRRIDRAALIAFELYVRYREEVLELRIKELKRNIPWAATRAAGGGSGESSGEPSS
jgi:hypothetical protein